MKINEVEKITGLTKKAIRLYENRGLINVHRSENGYRDYTEQDIKLLNQIKILRTAGISITDIKLLISGMLSLDDVVAKRKKEIDAESGLNTEQYAFCDTLAERISRSAERSDDLFIEIDDSAVEDHGALAVGIDLGTTTISAAVIDLDQKRQVEVFSVPHNAYVQNNVFFEQSVSVIIDKAEGLLNLIYKEYSDIVSIGLTGQMHGILYIDDSGTAVSDLMNWQDKRADLSMKGGESACQRIKRLTGETVATGYGIATHYYNLHNGFVPQNAVGFCSIMDYLGMRLCQNSRPTTHVSVAASFGLFDLQKRSFPSDQLSALGIEPSFLPRVTAANEIIGRWKDIPVTVAIGDNQASFLGSVKNNDGALLVNIGTGSQISAVGDLKEYGEGIEVRPLINDQFLVCGSPLCGGSSYAMLERFFRSYTSFAGLSDHSQYAAINQLAAKAYKDREQPLSVDTSFCGTRTDPHRRGAIRQIDLNHFTPSALALGVLDGICEELYQLSHKMLVKKSRILASGGAIRRNPTLQKLLADKFGMILTLSSVKEEAATGAALFSAYCIGRTEYNSGFSAL